MARRFVLATLGTFFVLLASAIPAEAQVKGDLGLGYSFLKVFEEEKIPVGWNVSIAGRGTDFISAVADFGGHYIPGDDDHFQLYTFTGGVRVHARRNSQVIPFVQATFGGVMGREDGDSDFAWAFIPGGGVDVPFRPDGPAFRAQVDFPIYFQGGDSATLFRFTASIVIPIR